jgi:type I restriction enzyme S subunit
MTPVLALTEGVPQMKTDAPGSPGKRPPTGHSQSSGEDIGESGGSKGMDGMRNFKLGDVIKLGNGKARPSSEGNIPIYGGNGILGYSGDTNYDGETIVIGRVGAYCGATYYENRSIWVSDNALSAKPKKGYSAKYLYYLLKNLDLNQQAQGSSHPLVTQTLLNSIDVEIAIDPDEQKAIAVVLSGLENKIDLLHRQNKTLEALAETLFRQWFVEEAQDDWKEVSVGDCVELNRSSIDKIYPHTVIQYLDTGSLTEGKIESLQSLDLSAAPSRAKRLVQHNDVVISTVRPDQNHFGILKNPVDNLVVSTGFCVLTCIDIDPHFILLLLTSDEMTDYLHKIAEGSTSTYPSLKPSDIGSIVFQRPPDKKIKEFSGIASNAWEKIEKNYIQIHILESMRDSLLPKLMSGEVRMAY